MLKVKSSSSSGGDGLVVMVGGCYGDDSSIVL